MFVISTYGQRIDYKLINVSALTNIINKTALIDSIDNMIDYTGWDVPKTSVPLRDHGQASCFYNEEDQQLILYIGLSYTTGLVGGKMTGWYRDLFFPFKVSAPSFFKDGIGTLTFAMTPKVDYKHFTVGGGMRSANYDSLWTSYDKYKKRIHTVYTGQQQLNSTIRAVPVTGRPQNHEYAFSGQTGITTYLSPPDASPWAKIVYSPVYLHDNVIYYSGRSDKYGDKKIASEYDLSTLKNNAYFSLVPNTWWIEDKEGSSSKGNHNNTAIIRVNATTNRYIYYDRTNLIEITHQDFIGSDGFSKKGKHIETILANPIPTLPTQYNYIGQCYDPVRNRAFFIVSDKTSLDPSKKGFPFLLYWGGGTTFIEFRNIAVWDDYATASKNSLGNVSFHMNSNFFIDLDGLVYHTCSYRTIGSGTVGRNTFVIDISQANPVAKFNTVMVPYTYSDNARIGYDNNRGYYITGGASTGTLLVAHEVRFSKSFNPADQERTKEQFFEGQYYKASIDLASAVGLVSYLQPTPIFLGGYYSMTEAEEIPLKANSDNYIYLERDAIDTRKVNVIVSTELIGGERGFGRVLVSKITTNDYKVIAQEDYPVEWDY